MINGQFSQRELIEQANALYIDYLTGNESIQSKNQRKSLRTKLISMTMEESHFPRILNEAEHIREKVIPHINEMERVASEVYFTDDEGYIEIVKGYQHQLIEEIADQIGINAEDLTEEIYFTNELFSELFSPTSRVA